MNLFAQKNETKERPKRDAEVENKQEVDGSDTAIIQLTGGFFQSAFGVAYTDDIQKVVKRFLKRSVLLKYAEKWRGIELI